MLRRFTQKIFRRIRGKIDLSFFNPAGVLVLVVALFTILHLVTMKSEAKGSGSAIADGSYADWKHIKPFTSLAVFNRRLHKEKPRLVRGEKPALFVFPVLHAKAKL